ncbi:MAG: CoA ester lyase, partial [Hyphomicrobiales bacterium]|nr:CoA ester lyase [Hyphomicrobiales bacterium]
MASHQGFGNHSAWLFAPADDAAKCAKALGAGADAVVLDIEDSVAPGRRAIALDLACAALRSPGRDRSRPVFVRLDSDDPALGADVFDRIAAAEPDGVTLAKCASFATIERVGAALAVGEARAGLPDGATRLVALVETAAGILSLPSWPLASRSLASRRLSGLALGLEDLARDIGVEAGRARRSAPLAAARALVPMAAAALGLAAIASPHVGLRDEAGLRRAAARARGDGFTGMFAVHPAQVAAIRAAFAPDDAT